MYAVSQNVVRVTKVKRLKQVCSSRYDYSAKPWYFYHRTRDPIRLDTRLHQYSCKWCNWLYC